MTRMIAGLVLLATVALGVAVAHQAGTRGRSYRLQLGRGDAALADRKTFDAIEAYSGAIALRPDSMLPYLRRGEAYLQRPDLEMAARDFGKAVALDPSAIRPLEDLGDVEYRRERFDRAVDSYERRLRLDDRSAEVTYKLALARYRTGDIPAALAALDQTVRLNGQFSDAYYLRGMCLRDLNRLSEAITAYARAIAIAPAAIAAREELADVYAALGRHNDEIEQLQAVAALDRDHPTREIALGLAHARAGQWDLAVLTLSGAVERSPNEPLLYQALGQVWLERPREKNDRVFLSKAREALQRVAAMPTASGTALMLYGRALLQDGDVDGAERTFRDAAGRYPLEVDVLLDYAAVAERQNHLDAARSALIEHETLAPDTAGAADRASRVAALSLRLNDPAAAVTWLRRALGAAPDDPKLFASLADAQVRAGDRAGADSTVARGLEKDPGNAALQALAHRLHPQPL